MSEKIVFLDASTIGPGVTVGRPDFAHEWQEYDRTAAEEVVSRLSDATICISNKVAITPDMLKQLPQLKIIAVAATGYNIVDLEACKSQGVAVCNIRGYAVNTVPEHTFSLILALRRNLIEYREQVLDGEWVRTGQFCFFNRPIRDLAGSNLGIIGAGALGQSVGRIGLAFGMKVMYLNQHIRTAPDHGQLVSLEQMRDEADILTLHCPLTRETQNIIDADFLAGMKESALVINTGRGGLVDEEALAQALKQGQIAGAGIDVTEVEPAPIDSPMMQVAGLPNVLLTPHVAWASVGGMQTLVDQLIGNIEAFVAGKPRNLLT
ncbi:D-2-hydroxyacid dehydrogenase [Leucothrix pacifica]|uniref:Glycerate dehydrogenase n=1 Tax=Leucothrix pacifica TaxID=1247513 RepID=A0A317CNY3_9GAMM|nr:D-2-hydroxyacid dehydrogenase [Leucothrix pacifica]PWQ98032.1 glycerate dehydrogenase [Leucothrix pacifica]